MVFTRQFDNMDCGPACIRMVASAYGKLYPLSYLRSLSHLTREGVSIAGIRDALKQIGMDSATFEMTVSALREDCPLPAILHWEQNHFVVLEKIKYSWLYKEWRYYVANPAYGRHVFSEKSFEEYWRNGEKGIVIALEPNESFYKKQPVKERHSFVRFAKRYAWPYKWEITQSSIGMLAGIIMSLVTPFLTQVMVDDGIGLKDMSFIVTILMSQIFFFLGSFSMGMIGNWVSLYMSARISIDILSDYLTKLLRLPMTFFETKSVGDYQQRMGDHGRLQDFITGSAISTFFSLVSVPILLTVIGWYSPMILGAYLFITVLNILWMWHFFNKRKAIDYEQFRLNCMIQNQRYEIMSGITDIKLNTYEKFKIDEWKDVQERQYQMSKRVLRIGQIQGTGYMLFGQLRNIIITCWIAAEVVNDNLTLGMMMSISSIMGQVDGPLSQLLGFMQQFQDAKISLERSEEVHLCPDEDNCHNMCIRHDKPLDIRIENLSFSYTGTDGMDVLKNVSFVIPAGRMTAIVGESGSGKTTLLKLLLKFYEPTSGHIYFGEDSLTQLTARSIRTASGIVMQENFIFSDTICRNIILGEKYDDARLNEAIDTACLNEYIKSLPLGTKTKIGSEGIGVSGGERQRIMIARAVYKSPLYLFMDEATSSLDAENERKITDNIKNQFKGHTRIVIAHRLSTVREADNIIVLRKGRIVEQGCHRQLVEQHGYYYKLIKNQLELADK